MSTRQVPTAELYERIFRWYYEHLVEIDGIVHDGERRGRSRALVENMPLPGRASHTEMRVIFHEVRTGLLEWAYGQRNGEDTNADIAQQGLDASGGEFQSTELDALQSEGSVLLEYSSFGPGPTRAGSARIPASPPPFEESETPDTSEDAEEEPAEAKPRSKGRPRGKRPRATTRPAPEPEDEPHRPHVPFDLTPYQISHGAMVILDRAAAIAASTDPTVALSTSMLFFVTIDFGKPDAEPVWSADFLQNYVNQRATGYEAARHRYYERRGVDAEATGGTPAQMSANTADLLALAAVIAKRTTDDGAIAARHLAAAMLTESEAAERPLKRLNELGIDVPALRERLYGWLRGYGDNDDAWREILLTAGPVSRRVSDFRADDARGPDLLDIEQDVVALGTVIAARAVSPPLSIGLFGDWGSGKTFFMRQLKQLVADLSKEARGSTAMQRDLPFYKRIVQIEFNAWHYVEGNLWASLVEHIFSNLYLPDDDRGTKVEEMQKHWIKQLGFAEAKTVDAEQTQLLASQRVTAAEDDVKTRRLAYEARKADVQALSAKSVARDFHLAGVDTALATALEPLGLKPASNAVNDLQSTLRQARTVVGRGNRVLVPLFNAKDRGARLTWLLISLFGGIAVAAAIGIILARMGDGNVSRIYSLIAGAATTIGVGTKWVRDQLHWVSEQLTAIETAQQKYDGALQKELAATTAAVAAAEHGLAEQRQDLVAAQQRADDAHRDRDAIKKELADVTSARLLARFIQDRASSVDYRKHLGVLALVRDDFEQLSELIEHENWRLSPDDGQPSRFAGKRSSPTEPPIPRFTTLEDENTEAGVRINRIVLYIDDLDRCPPAKVVEVLQAVHLLLAFPLFVVVVGVDARWVSRSLESRYRELLKGGSTDAAGDLTSMFGVARSEDYLEKIFQIPLWLRPMTTPDVQRMVRGLVRAGWANRVAPAAQADVVPDASPTSAKAADGPASGGERRASQEQPRRSGSTDQPKVDEPPSRAMPNVESLEIGDDELRAITNLSPLLGRSPRSLKRFVNIYRLIKAGLSPNELREFMRPQKQTLSDFEKVLFLLAVDTGLPRVSRALFHVLVALGDNPPEHRRSLIALVGDTERRVNAESKRGSAQDAAVVKEWITLRQWVEARTPDTRFTTAILELDDWVARVSQFSFQAGSEARNAESA